MPYRPIENYGLIGNMRTAALVSDEGSIDWLCLPRFDAPSVFAAILDDGKGGRFQIRPAVDGLRHKQFYWPDTNVLITRFYHADGVAELEDYMPVGGDDGPRDELVRRVRVVRGRLPITVRCDPAFDYARGKHKLHLTDGGARFVTAALTLTLAASVPVRRDAHAAAADFPLGEGESATFVLAAAGDDEPAEPQACPVGDAAEARFRETVQYWRKWLSKCTYRGRWRESVQRSALALKLLTYEPTGAIVAAPTCGLPEQVGGVRNWDYRYCWLRDASFTLYGLLRIGFTDEAEKFMNWLAGRWSDQDPGPDGPLRIAYSVGGSPVPPEQELSHLDGYRGSRPVRIGNAAAEQLQLDIYGELMDAVYLYNKHAAPVGFDAWTRLRKVIDWVDGNWQRPDEGLWEVRGGRQHFVFSKMMCWVALDRGLRLADKRSFPADRARWAKSRDAILEEVMTRGWDAGRGAFVQAYGSDALDASNLLMPLVFFTAPNDPRMLSTIDAIRTRASRGGLAANGLIYRYRQGGADVDGLPGDEGTFNMCTFWLVEALTRAGRTDRRRLDDARLLFEQMLTYANPLGLYAEETGPSGEALGNFPQAFTHLSQISAAFNLDRALGGG